METEINDILAQRGSAYGDFERQAMISQEFKKTLNIHRGAMEPYKLESLEMLLHKVARIINGDSNYIESWRDIVGYTQLVVNKLQTTEGATDGRVIKQIVQNRRIVDMP